jgi:hypothetical protein
MTDTMRSLSSLTTLLADNNAGDISAQDLRDAVIASLPAGYAAAYISDSSATSPSDTATWVTVAGGWTLEDSTSNWSMGTNGQFQWDGAADRQANVSVALSMTTENNNQQTQFAIGVNGTATTSTIIQRYVNTGADVGAAAVVGHVDVSNGDYISLMCRNITSATDITVLLASLTIADFPA